MSRESISTVSEKDAIKNDVITDLSTTGYAQTDIDYFVDRALDPLLKESSLDLDNDEDIILFQSHLNRIISNFKKENQVTHDPSMKALTLELPKNINSLLRWGAIDQSESQKNALQSVASLKSRQALLRKQIDDLENARDDTEKNKELLERIDASTTEIVRLYDLIMKEAEKESRVMTKDKLPHTTKEHRRAEEEYENNQNPDMLNQEMDRYEAGGDKDLAQASQALEQIAQMREDIKLKMSASFAEEDQVLEKLGRTLFDLLGENETNIEQKGYPSKEVGEVDAQFAAVLEEFENQYSKLESIHENESHISQEEIQSNEYVDSINTVFADIMSRFTLDEKIPYLDAQEKQKNQTLTLLKDTVVEVLDKFGPLSVEFRESYKEYTTACEVFMSESQEAYESAREQLAQERSYNALSLSDKKNVVFDEITEGYADVKEQIEKSISINEQQKIVLLAQLRALQNENISAVGTKETTEDTLSQVRNQWQKERKGIIGMLHGEKIELSSPDESDPVAAFKDRTQAQDSLEKLAALEKGILLMQQDIEHQNENRLKEKLPSLDREKAGWRRKLMHLGSDILSKFTITAAAAGVLFSATTSEGPDGKPKSDVEASQSTSVDQSIASTGNPEDVHVAPQAETMTDTEVPDISIPMTDIDAISSPKVPVEAAVVLSGEDAKIEQQESPVLGELTDTDTDFVFETAPQPESYTLKKGDNLWNIATGKVLGLETLNVLQEVPKDAHDRLLMNVITKLFNSQESRDRIGIPSGYTNPNRIPVGMKLDMDAFSDLIREVAQKQGLLSSTT